LLGPCRYRRQIGLVNDNVRIRAQKPKCLEALSENRERWNRCDIVDFTMLWSPYFDSSCDNYVGVFYCTSWLGHGR